MVGLVGEPRRNEGGCEARARAVQLGGPAANRGSYRIGRGGPAPAGAVAAASWCVWIGGEWGEMWGDWDGGLRHEGVELLGGTTSNPAASRASEKA